MEQLGPLYQELKTLREDNTTVSTFRLRADLIVQGKVYESLKVTELFEVNNYRSEFAADLKVQCMVPLGLLNHRIFPNRRDVKVRLHKEPVYPDSLEPITNKPVVVETYLATPDIRSSAIMQDPTRLNTSESHGDTAELVPVDFQLMPVFENEWRQRQIMGIYKNVTLEELMKLLMRPGATQEPVTRPPVLKKKPWVLGEFEGMVGMEIAPPDNTKRYRQIILPMGLRVVDLPNYLQSEYGVYENGIGSYFYRGLVWVFPTTDIDRYNEVTRNLTIYNLASDAAPGSEITHHVNRQGKVKVVSTGEVEHEDIANFIQLNRGIGSYSMFSEGVLNKTFDLDENKEFVVIDKSKNMTRTTPVYRDDKNDQLQMSDRPFNNNVYREESLAKEKRFASVNVSWENADPFVLYPGMPSMFKFEVGDTVAEMNGTLLGMSASYTPLTSGVRESVFRCYCNLAVAIPSVGL